MLVDWLSTVKSTFAAKVLCYVVITINCYLIANYNSDIMLSMRDGYVEVL